MELFPPKRLWPGRISVSVAFALISTHSGRAQLPPAALVAKGSISVMQGTVDSFDSGDAAYSTNGRYDPAKAKANGNVVSLGGISVQANSHVFGHVWVGVDSPVVTSSVGSIGDFNWARGVEPGWVLRATDFTLPDLQTPSLIGPRPGPGVIITNGSTNYFNYLLTGGIYVLTNASGSLGVTAPSFLYVPNGFDASITVAIGASLTLIVDKSCSISGAYVADGSVTNLTIQGLPGLTNLTLTTDLTGTIYAPHANLRLIAATLTGCVAADSIVVGPGYSAVHYDERLSRSLPPMAAMLNLPRLSPTNGMQFNVIGSPGVKYAVEVSTNLIDWVSIQTNVAPFIAADPDACSFPSRYYRAVSVP